MLRYCRPQKFPTLLLLKCAVPGNIHTSTKKGIFSKTPLPHPSGNSNWVSYFALNFVASEDPHPFGISNPFLWGGGGGINTDICIIWKYTTHQKDKNGLFWKCPLLNIPPLTWHLLPLYSSTILLHAAQNIICHKTFFFHLFPLF